MAVLRAAGLSCLLLAIASASPLPETSDTTLSLTGDIIIENPTVIDEVSTTTVTVYETSPPTSSAANASSIASASPITTINPGGPVSPVYPFPNSTAPSYTGTAASTGLVGTGSSSVWLYTGTAPQNTGASTGIAPSPSDSVLPPYINTTSSPAYTSAPSSGLTTSANSTTTVLVASYVSPAGTSAVGTPTSSSPSIITPTPIITPAPTSTETPSAQQIIASAYEEIERIIEEVIAELFPFLGALPGFDIAALAAPTS